MLFRRLVITFLATSLVSVGVAGVAGAHDDEMSPQEMKCMAKKYKENHPKLCGTKAAGHGSAHAAKPVAIKHALKYTADGTIDPRKVNLSGIPGVSRKDEKAAQKLLIDTIKVLPRWSDPTVAAAEGFKSIGDGLTGEEHMLHWDWIDDTTVFDPAHPESLVYKVDRATGKRTLEAAMYILPKDYTLDKTPAIDSKLVQFHQHDNLCFTTGDAPRVAGLTLPDGSCRAPLVKFNPNIQVHVWIRQNDCGPFASLLGVGAGQIKSGQKRSCVHSENRLGL